MVTVPTAVRAIWNSEPVGPSASLFHCSNCSHMTVLGTVTWSSGGDCSGSLCSNCSALFHAWELEQW